MVYYINSLNAHTETPDFELHDDLKKTICLRAGGSLRLFVKVTGRPVPALIWSKPGVDLQNRGFIEVTNKSTTLIIDKVHRYDAGKYTLVAENSAGKQEVNILVKVYGKLIKMRIDGRPLAQLVELTCHVQRPCLAFDFECCILTPSILFPAILFVSI